MGYTVLENWGYAKPILTEKWIKTAAGWRYAHREGEAGRVVRDDSMADEKHKTKKIRRRCGVRIFFCSALK